REVARTALAAEDFEITVTEVLEGDALRENLRDSTARQIELLVRAPSVVLSPLAGEGLLRRDAEGRVVREGDVTFPVTVLVPRSVVDGTFEGPARLLQYGHGFFGTREELISSSMDDFADDHGFVAMAADWWGMMRDDRDVVAQGLADARPGELH